MSTLPQVPPPSLEDMAARIGEIERAAERLLADAACLREGMRRMEAVTGVPLLPPPAGHRLSLVPPLPA